MVSVDSSLLTVVKFHRYRYVGCPPTLQGFNASLEGRRIKATKAFVAATTQFSYDRISSQISFVKTVKYLNKRNVCQVQLGLAGHRP